MPSEHDHADPPTDETLPRPAAPPSAPPSSEPSSPQSRNKTDGDSFWVCSTCEYQNPKQQQQQQQQQPSSINCCALCGSEPPDAPTTPTPLSPLPPELVGAVSPSALSSSSAGLMDLDEMEMEPGAAAVAAMPPLPDEIPIKVVTTTTTTTTPSLSHVGSLRNTVNSISERLLDIQVTAVGAAATEIDEAAAEEGKYERLRESTTTLPVSNPSSTQRQQQEQEQRPQDDEPISASALTVQASNSFGTGDGDRGEAHHLVFTDDQSSSQAASPTAIPDDISLEDLFAGQLMKQPKNNNKEEEEKEEVQPEEFAAATKTSASAVPQSRRRIVGFETLPPSPQRQPQPQSVEPWEMPPIIHIPDLTATSLKHHHHHHSKKEGDETAGTEKDEDARSVESTSPARRLTRLIVCCVVVFVLFLSILLIPDAQNDKDLGGPGVLITPSPTTSTAPALPTVPTPRTTTTPTLRPSRSPTKDDGSSTSIPTTMTTLAPVTVNFTPEATFSGASAGSRLGTSVVMDPAGTFMAALDGLGSVQVYYTPSSSSSPDWQMFPSLASVEGEPATSIDMVVVEGAPLLAMASEASVRVVIYDTATEEWIPQGQSSIQWLIAENTSPIVSLSSDGNTLAFASLVNGGRNAIIQVWQWTGTLWTPQGDAVILIASSTTAPFHSLSLVLSGSVFVVGDWTLALPAVTVQAYQWNGVEWAPKGSSPTFLWGPSDLALTDDGNYFAVTTPIPGSARVYRWNDEIQDWEMMGGELMGGSSIAIADTGRRVMVGSSLTSTVVVYDFNTNSGVWEATSLLSGAVGDQYGTSVAMSGNGNTLAVGSPLDHSSEGSNAGKALIYA